jgi:hypothetical protein
MGHGQKYLPKTDERRISTVAYFTLDRKRRFSIVNSALPKQKSAPEGALSMVKTLLFKGLVRPEIHGFEQVTRLWVAAKQAHLTE